VDGWSPEMTLQQVLAPIEDSLLFETLSPDSNSIMCYQPPGTIMKDNQPVLGKTNIDESDYAFMSTSTEWATSSCESAILAIPNE
jgi:hypothetical protein